MHVNETEVRYRMERLAAEADLARLARVASGAPAAHRPGRARRLVGHLFISIGSAMQGAAPCPDEQAGAARA